MFGTESEPLRIMLVDDHEMFIEGLRIVIGAEPDITVVAVACDGPGALAAAAEHQPRVIVVDLHIPGSSVEDLVPKLHQAVPDAHVLVLSGDSRPEALRSVLAAGAAGFLGKDASSRQVVAAVRRLGAGDGWEAVPAGRPSLEWSDPAVTLLVRSLTPRELEVLALLVAGCSNRKIAEQCFLSLNTVRTHVQNILVKLGVHSKLEAAAFALRHGVVPRMAEFSGLSAEG